MYAEALILVLNKVLTSINTNLVENLNNCLVKIAKATITSTRKVFMLIFKILKIFKNDTISKI
jgi:hypothetical protein